MNKYVTGMVVGSLVGAAASMVIVNKIEPRLGRMIARKGKGMAKQYKRKIMKMDML